jgi:hypothetical protein
MSQIDFNRSVNFIKKWIEMQPFKFVEGTPLRAALEGFIAKLSSSKSKTDEECAKLLQGGLVIKTIDDAYD